MPVTLRYAVTEEMVWAVTSCRSVLCEMAEQWRLILQPFILSSCLHSAVYGAAHCALFVKATNSMRSVMWQCTVSSVICGSVLSAVWYVVVYCQQSDMWQCTVSSLICGSVLSAVWYQMSSVFVIYCCPFVVLYEVLKSKVGLSCTNNLLLVLLL